MWVQRWVLVWLIFQGARFASCTEVCTAASTSNSSPFKPRRRLTTCLLSASKNSCLLALCYGVAHKLLYIESKLPCQGGVCTILAPTLLTACLGGEQPLHASTSFPSRSSRTMWDSTAWPPNTFEYPRGCVQKCRNHLFVHDLATAKDMTTTMTSMSLPSSLLP